MKKVYFLKTCDTCKRIMKEIGIDSSFDVQNIKESPITEEQLEELYKRTANYETLFNKQSRFYKSENLKSRQLSEVEIRNYILQEYTLLKRPIFLFQDAVFIGNTKNNIAALKEYLAS